MELFPFTESGTPILLSVSDSGLFLHPVHNEHFGHPILLCSGYKNGFSGCIYNDSLHYAYINKENSLLLRRLHESTTLFRLDSADTVTYRTPQLVPAGGSLFLFYFAEEHGSYRLKLRVPLSGSEPALPEAFQTAFPKLPTLSLQTTDRYLYLFLIAGTTHISYRYANVSGFEPLCSESELLSELRLPWKDEKKRLEQGLMQAIHLSEQQQNLLTEKEQKMQLAEAKLAECEQKRFKTAQELEQTSLLLERAKAQYNELMQVAEQYRQEALKWYGKFTDRH